jgi:Phage integrase, N-terminal SAM-like domain
MTTTSSPSTVIAVTEPVFTNAERLALAEFLAGYTGLTREAYALDLRQFTAWCKQHNLRLFQVRRADIECFARDLEAKGRARATVTRRLSRRPQDYHALRPSPDLAGPPHYLRRDRLRRRGRPIAEIAPVVAPARCAGTRPGGSRLRPITPRIRVHPGRREQDVPVADLMLAALG